MWESKVERTRERDPSAPITRVPVAVVESVKWAVMAVVEVVTAVKLLDHW